MQGDGLGDLSEAQSPQSDSMKTRCSHRLLAPLLWLQHMKGKRGHTQEHPSYSGQVPDSAS